MNSKIQDQELDSQFSVGRLSKLLVQWCNSLLQEGVLPGWMAYVLAPHCLLSWGPALLQLVDHLAF